MSNFANQSSSSNDLIDFSREVSAQSIRNHVDEKRRDNNGIVAETKVAQPIEMAPALYRATMTYPASTQYELNLDEGDIVILIKKREDG